MPTGMLFIFAPLLVGYLIQTSNTAFLSGVNRTTNYLIVVILALMGLSLASLDNLGQNLQLILQYVVVFSVCIGLSNLAALPIVDKLFPIQGLKAKKYPFTFNYGFRVNKANSLCWLRSCCG